MLTDQEISELVTDLESDRVERKRLLSDREGKDRVCQAICAFANDLPGHNRPGVVLIGVDDDGSLANTLIDDDLLKDLAQVRGNGNILPFPNMTVQRRTVNGTNIAVIEVQPSFSPPVRYNNIVWVRVGPSRAKATADEERILSEKRRYKDIPYDGRPFDGAEISDLDLELFRNVYLPSAVASEVLEENHRTVEEQLRSLRFLGRQGVPTVGGLLTVGRDPRSWIPGAYLQFLRIDGTELTDPISHQEELPGPLPDLLPQLDRVLRSQIRVQTRIPAVGVEERSPDYPLDALVQLARNAVLHRNYETSSAPTRIYWYRDRIEIHSPGGPYGQVTAENFGQPGITDYRNPLIAEAMKSLGYVQRFGFGITSARREFDRNGNPAPEFQVQPTAVLVTLRPRP